MSSPWARRWRRFRAHRRGWASLLTLAALFGLSLLNPLLISDRAWAVSHRGELYLPVLHGYIEGRALGQPGVGEARYRDLREQYAREGTGDWVILAPYPYGPDEHLMDLPGSPPHPPSAAHWMGTDTHGRDVLVRLAYGFRLSMGFGLGVLCCAYPVGIGIGAALGFAGRAGDLLGQRLVEVWSGLPFVYVVLVVSSLVRANLVLLVALVSAFSWMWVSAYVRAEVYRERAKPYVLAAIAYGEAPASVLVRHVLPNALVSAVTFAPFAFVAFVTDLVQLEYLGFGLSADAPSWGQLVGQGLENLRAWHLVVFPLGAMFVTLMLVVFVGEAVRDAVDPRPVHRMS